MKYTFLNQSIPQNRREDVNEKLLQIVESGNDALSKNDIYNAYTGDGGLHGLSLDDFANFHEYTEAKKEVEQGQFFTPHHLCEFIVDTIRPSNNDFVADLTCGIGNFFNFLPNEKNVWGNELDIKAYKIAKHLYPIANLTCMDIRYFHPSERFDLILGNPPFNLDFGDYKSQMYYCRKAFDLLRTGGILALIVPMSFLADDFMDGGSIRMINERFNFVFQKRFDPKSFKQYGADYVETKMMVFQKISEHLEHKPYQANLFVDDVFAEALDSETLHKKFIVPILEEKEKIRHKLFFEQKHSGKEDELFAFKVRKLLFDIRRNPKINAQYDKALARVEQYHTQQKPEDMNWKEWESKKLTPNKVLSYLNRIVRNQNEVEQDKIRMVKTRYGIKLKAYSRKTKANLGKSQRQTVFEFNEMVLDETYPFSDETYQGLVNRKIRDYQRQNVRIEDMGRDAAIDAYLDTFTITDASTGEVIHLNENQKHDLGLIMQKRYAILNWQMGSGKTIAGIAWYQRLLQAQKVRNVFVVSAALAIDQTWEVRLKHYGENAIRINKLADIDRVQKGQVVLITLDMLIKYRKHVQKFVKMQSQKIALLVDESDELTNHSSKRTKATLACFRRVKYKLLTTGTTTRNNINELYPQFELLYNNSINMLCECDHVYRTNKENEIVEDTNNEYMMPFPAHGGQSLWKASFCPAKATVFGIRKFNQDIYNQEALVNLIEKTIITKKFEEIVGEKKHTNIIEPHRILQNEAERDVYFKIMKEFHAMCAVYYRSTGNSRKDSMLKLIRQIQLMIKACSVPHKFREYVSSELPSKYMHIIEMIRSFDEKVAIGTVFVDTAEEYVRILQEEFPERPVFLVKGDVTFKKRGGIIEQFEATNNGILVSTQQSLKSSVNIPTVNKVIVESLQWNCPKIDQYVFRFIRYNSTDQKEIHYVTYDRTIEQNMLALLMTKERINEYIKTLEFKDQSDIFEEYDIDMSLLNSIIEKERDEEGHVYLTWGNQRVC